MMTMTLLWYAFSAFWYLALLVGIGSLVTMMVPMLYSFFLRSQDLKQKYGAEWAIVTGGSSGIGKAIVEKLVKQDINVIIVAAPDKVLAETVKEMRGKYPKVKVEEVAADLSKPGFMQAVDEVTKDKKIQLLFCNAGFIVSGFFVDDPFKVSQVNKAVNVDCHLELAHEYVNRMIDGNLRGAVCFTSSPAWMLPSPTAAMYAATKAFLSNFGAALAGEVKMKGIDVCVLHPSPTLTSFYANADKEDSTLAFFKSTATGPQVVADALFASIGRLVWCNQGYFPKVFGLLGKLLDFSFLLEIVTNTAHTVGSFKLAHEAGLKKRAKAK